MKRTFIVFSLAALAAFAAAVPALAHHSFAKDYDETRQISLEGQITSFEMKNPHSWVYFTAKDSTGVVRQYGAEWANRSRLIQAGMTAETLKAGDHIVVTGAPNRDATEYSVHLKGITRPSDGWSWPDRGGQAGQTTARRYFRR